MKIVVDLRGAPAIEAALRQAFPDAFRVVVGYSSATVLDDREDWQEVRFSRELSALVRADGYVSIDSPMTQQYTVQIVRRGKGPRRSGEGRYPACG